jgi:hypothetical protein
MIVFELTNTESHPVYNRLEIENAERQFTFMKSVLAAMDKNDRLAVINAQNGVVTNWDHPPIDAINAIWLKA